MLKRIESFLKLVYGKKFLSPHANAKARRIAVDLEWLAGYIQAGGR